jgi:hypothetical protein
MAGIPRSSMRTDERYFRSLRLPLIATTDVDDKVGSGHDTAIMGQSMSQLDTRAFYNQHYSVVADYPLVAARPVFLSDHSTNARRRCRFCGRGRPEVTFGPRAHAAPAFLGNRSIFSSNECYGCNQHLADYCEDHLAKKLLFLRAIGQIRGRNGAPTFEADRIRVETEGDNLVLTITDAELFKEQSQSKQIAFSLPLQTPSQPYIPIRAAMALVKIACSTSPTSELSQVQPAIDWLMGRAEVRTPTFPVLRAFTPGTDPHGAGHVKILRRTSDEPIPYLWCIVATGNFRFQVFVPFCPADTWLRSGQPVSIRCRHFPLLLEDKGQHEETEYDVFNWAGTELVAVDPNATLNVDSAERVDGMPDSTPREQAK